jgi:hypothetical protein
MSKEVIKKDISDILTNKKEIPARFALNPERFSQLFCKPGETIFRTKDGETISQEDQMKYFPQAYVYCNVSKQFPDEL